MTDERAAMLARIRQARPGGAAVPPVARDYRTAGERPAGDPELLDLLAQRLVDYRATVDRTTAAELPAVIAAAVTATLPPGGRLVVPPGLPPGWAPAGATVDDGGLTVAEIEGFAGVLTGCAAAAAETGTIVLDASAGQGRRLLTLLPDRHVCVVLADQVVQTVPELLARLDPRRPLTFISGPSATSDIELDRVEGVHGPRHLRVVICRPAR